MRFLIMLLLVTATSGISAQQLLFDKTIPEQNLPETSRLKSEMRSTYINSRYVTQSDFLSQQDFFIAITSNLIVKSKFVRMHNYPYGSFSYEGRLEGSVTGHISFSKYGDRTAGMISLVDGRKYMIDQVASNIFAISLSNESAFTQLEKHDDFIEISGESQPNASVAGICDGNPCSGSSTIDIIVVYTQQAENNWGGTSNTIANITQAVTNMNSSMSGSGINNVMFRLVHAAKVSYTESGNFSTDLTRLAGNSDGYIDNVHALRDQYGADLVSMVIGSPTSSCGIGYLNTNPTSYSASSAFNVSLYSCAVGNFTMAHESGHNMGLRHDWYVDASTTPCSHQHGYVNMAAIAQGTSSPSSSRWRTIMAYNDRCAVAGFNCTRINIWSNPNLNYNGDAQGQAIGTAEASDEAYAFYRMACLVAAFRPTAGSSEGGGTCIAPSGLNTENITTTSASASWSPVSGAHSYNVDYKESSSGTWINIASPTTSTTWGLAAMSPSTTYDWRVRANCSTGNSGYRSTQFSTLSISLPTCDAPGGLSTSDITSGTATLNWGSVSGAFSYTVEYKPAFSSTWITATSATYSTSVNLYSLSAATTYDWRVKSNCTLTESSNYNTAQFATSGATPPPTSPTCPGPYDISTNGTAGGAASIPLNTDVKGTVSTRGDIDHFQFILSSGGTVTVSLTTLPANYNLEVLNGSGILLATSQNNGSRSETINLNLAAGNYFAKVVPKGNASNASSCYTLRVQTGTATDVLVNPDFTIRLFPNPGEDHINVWIDGVRNKTEIKVYDLNGKLIMKQTGNNLFNRLNISKLTAGFYLVYVYDGKVTRSAKFVKK